MRSPGSSPPGSVSSCRFDGDAALKAIAEGEIEAGLEDAGACHLPGGLPLPGELPLPRKVSPRAMPVMLPSKILKPAYGDDLVIRELPVLLM